VSLSIARLAPFGMASGVYGYPHKDE